MVEAFLIREEENTFIGGIDEPKVVKLTEFNAKEIVLVSDPFKEQRVVEIVEKLSTLRKCSKIGLLLTPTSALYAMNETTGLVIDMTEEGTYFNCVYEGKFLPYCSLKYNYTLKSLFKHFKDVVLPTLSCKSINLRSLSDLKKRELFNVLLSESVPNDERECIFVSVEQEDYEGSVYFEGKDIVLNIPKQSRTLLLQDLFNNHNFHAILYETLLRIPSRIRNTIASHILLLGPFLIQDMESVLRTGLFKYLCSSDNINENQLSSISFVNRLAIDHMEIARENGNLWFSGGLVSRKYLLQDDKYHLTDSEFTTTTTILNKLCH